ncbi:MAG: hypothetical protein L3J35_03635 [Bacteroidales bacterium]|nr:hypothetical protein [Bacteroidales bacterium]
METNYFLLIIIYLTVIFKALADGYNYKYNVSQNEHDKSFFGVAYHIFGILTIGIPITSILIKGFGTFDFLFIIIAFALIYFGIFDFLYNKITGRNSLYIGKTDIFDKIIGKFIKTPNAKILLFVFRWACFIAGTSLILDFI